jgi:hypothetical protein
MQLFSFHLAETTPATTAMAICRPPTSSSALGLRHAECMAAMTLGSPIVSPARMQLRNLAMFAAWESEAALDAFLAQTKLGRALTAGWHVRLNFLRQWGRFAELGELPANDADADPAQPVVAVTLARLRLPQLARFVQWGKPVEEQVRDHPGATLALAAFRPPRTFSTFSVWRSQREMTDMVHGRDSTLDADRHAAAMIERNRKDFHHQFTTLRFRAMAEHGEWAGRRDIVPK